MLRLRNLDDYLDWPVMAESVSPPDFRIAVIHSYRTDSGERRLRPMGTYPLNESHRQQYSTNLTITATNPERQQ